MEPKLPPSSWVCLVYLGSKGQDERFFENITLLIRSRLSNPKGDPQPRSHVNLPAQAVVNTDYRIADNYDRPS